MFAVSLGAPELMIVLAVVLLLFGSTQLPKLARSVGRAQQEFKRGTEESGAGTEEPATRP